jgi:hypothetical protein
MAENLTTILSVSEEKVITLQSARTGQAFTSFVARLKLAQTAWALQFASGMASGCAEW